MGLYRPNIRVNTRAAVGTEFLSPYPFHTHTHVIPYGIPIPTAESRAAVGTEYLSLYHFIPTHMGTPIPTADLVNT